jgi:hypothetical protein
VCRRECLIRLLIYYAQLGETPGYSITEKRKVAYLGESLVACVELACIWLPLVMDPLMLLQR